MKESLFGGEVSRSPCDAITSDKVANAQQQDTERALPSSSIGDDVDNDNDEKLPPSSAATEIGEPYSLFTRPRRCLIILLATFAATFSPLSSFIFFPAVSALSAALHVSIARIDLTITSYMIVAGIAPAVLGDLADVKGRRPVYILMMGVYCVANVGLALQSNWTALFVLRMVQSVGSAATIAIGYGVVSDIASPAERGEFVSGMVMGPNIATAVGPIIGGVLVEIPGWRWVFWFLSILSGTCLLLIVVFLPETARSVVGNGSKDTSSCFSLVRSALCCLVRRARPSPKNTLDNPPSPAESGTSNNSSSSNKTFDPTQKEIKGNAGNNNKGFYIPNPIKSLRLLWAKDCFLIVLIFGTFYMNLSCVQASTSSLFISLYGLTELQAGLVYLPSGIGSIIGAYGAGYVLKRDYRITARKHGMEIDVRRGDDISTFPVEEARLRSIAYFITCTGISTIGYGWALHSRVNMALPLILQFLLGLSTAVVFNASATLLTDIHPKSPSTASAANSIVRCLLAGAGLGVVQILIDSIGIHWTFTLYGGVCLVGCLLVTWVEWRCGRRWRERMRERGVDR